METASRGYEIVDFNELSPTACPCGQARRAFLNADDFPLTIHRTEISAAAKTHFHNRLTETYYILHCEADAAMALDGKIFPVRPGMCILIRPGVRHRAIGRMTVLIVVSPNSILTMKCSSGAVEFEAHHARPCFARCPDPESHQPSPPAPLPLRGRGERTSATEAGQALTTSSREIFPRRQAWRWLPETVAEKQAASRPPAVPKPARSDPAVPRFPPRNRNPRLAPIGAGKLSADGPGGVRIVAEVHRPQHSLAEVLGLVEGPQRRFEAANHVAGTHDLGRFLLAETAPGHFIDLGVQWADFLQPEQRQPERTEHFPPGKAMDQTGQDQSQVRARGEALRAGVGRQAGLHRKPDQLVEAVGNRPA